MQRVFKRKIYAFRRRNFVLNIENLTEWLSLHWLRRALRGSLMFFQLARRAQIQFIELTLWQKPKSTPCDWCKCLSEPLMICHCDFPCEQVHRKNHNAQSSPYRVLHQSQGDKQEINPESYSHVRTDGLFLVYRLEEDETFCKKVMVWADSAIGELAHQEMNTLIPSGATAPILFKGFILVFVVLLQFSWKRIFKLYHGVCLACISFTLTNIACDVS